MKFPDLVVEIISEHSAYKDLIQKKQLYAKFKIKEYWIVIPEESPAEFYVLTKSSYHLHKKYYVNDSLITSFLPALEIPLHQIF